MLFPPLMNDIEHIVKTSRLIPVPDFRSLPSLPEITGPPLSSSMPLSYFESPPPTSPVVKKRISKLNPLQNHKLEVLGEDDIVKMRVERLHCVFPECSASFSTDPAFKRHLKDVHHIGNSHSSTNEIVCPVSACRRTMSEGGLMKHIFGHLDANRVMCGRCGKSYSRIAYLRHHIKLKHGKGKEKEKG